MEGQGLKALPDQFLGCFKNVNYEIFIVLNLHSFEYACITHDQSAVFHRLYKGQCLSLKQ